MRLHKVALLLIIPMLLAAGCSRLTFVKPKMQRKDGEQIAPDYHVSDTPATKQRIAAQEQLGRALQNLQAGKLDAAEQNAKAVLKVRPDSADATTLMAVIEDSMSETEREAVLYETQMRMFRGSRPEPVTERRRQHSLGVTSSDAVDPTAEPPGTSTTSTWTRRRDSAVSRCLTPIAARPPARPRRPPP